MSKIEVNAVEPQCGNTLTLGASGDTITIPAGATITNNGTQTGFGRTGTVDWQTSIKTASFTAVSGEGYFCNTTSGAFTVTLPASPSVGDIVSVKDYASTFDTNNLTIARNSSNIEGSADDRVLVDESQSVTLIYADATKGWLVTNDMNTGQSIGYVAATGGTITTSGDFKIHTFTSPGTFTVSCAGTPLGSSTVDYLVVAGAGGASGDIGGGGGAGGFRLSNSTCMPSPQTSPLANSSGLPVTVQSYPITVGSGGSGSPGGNAPTTDSSPGSNSVFSTITSTGGGGVGYDAVGCSPAGNSLPGGSGGGAKRGTSHTGGSGNTPPVSPPQGNDGGDTPAPPNSGSKTRSAGGGGAGGAGAAGQAAPACTGAGGVGSYVVSSGFAGCNGTTGPISGARYFSGGGSGGGNAAAGSPPTAGTVGGGGGSNSGDCGPAGDPGVANTGGGGSGGGNDGAGGNGGSGIVIIRYKFQ